MTVTVIASYIPEGGTSEASFYKDDQSCCWIDYDGFKIRCEYFSNEGAQVEHSGWVWFGETKHDKIVEFAAWQIQVDKEVQEKNRNAYESIPDVNGAIVVRFSEAPKAIQCLFPLDGANEWVVIDRIAGNAEWIAETLLSGLGLGKDLPANEFPEFNCYHSRVIANPITEEDEYKVVLVLRNQDTDSSGLFSCLSR